MIEKVVRHMAKCDRCSKEFWGKKNTSIVSLNVTIFDIGWVQNGTHLYCPQCKDIEVPKPKPKKTFIHVGKLRDRCAEYMDFIDKDLSTFENTKANYENAIFEAAMTAIYGPEVWDYINSKI